MEENAILHAMKALDIRTKAVWESGWAALCTHGYDWSCLIYDNDVKSSIFTATTAQAAIDQANRFLDHNAPLTRERLASVLGITVDQVAA